MSFFEHLKHSIFGNLDPESNERQREKNAFKGTQTQDLKQIPELRIEDTDTRNNGQDMEVHCIIRNDSDKQVFLDKIRILGVKRELDTALRTYEARKFLLYSGPRPKNTSYGMAEIDYHHEGDYFQVKCRVEFRQEPDRTYAVRRITATGPMKDI